MYLVRIKKQDLLKKNLLVKQINIKYQVVTIFMKTNEVKKFGMSNSKEQTRFFQKVKIH